MNLAGKLELWAIDKLIPYELNTKNHPKEQIEKLAKTIDQNGFDVPIVVDEAGVILKGHGRRLAALHLGVDKVPVLVRSGLSEKQKKAIRIGDNTLASLGTMDFEALSQEIELMMSLPDDFEVDLDDLGLAGFNFDIEDDTANTLGTSQPTMTPARTAQSTQSVDDEKPAEKDYSMPDLSQEKAAISLFQVVAQCKDEHEQREVYELLVENEHQARILTI
jgi:hypothetical protein